MGENMSRKNVFIAILAGGKGERLWPKSRAAYPKQHLRLLGSETLLQNSVKRAQKIAPGNIFIVTGKSSLPYLKGELKKAYIKKTIIEPFGRNTAPAIGLAALLTFRKNNNSILVVMPSDSLIGNEKKFFKAVNNAVKIANKKNTVVTFGVKPTSAATTYGYIGINERPSQILTQEAYRVTKFVEKPDSERAGRLIKDGRYFWNSGIFIFRTSIMLEMLKKHTPLLYKGLMGLPPLDEKKTFEKGLKMLYRKIKGESLDYAVLEKSLNIQTIPVDFKWSDLGSFETIARFAKKDRNKNIILGNHIGIDTKRSLVFSSSNCLVSTIGVNDVIIVFTPDAVLICDRKRSDEIRKLVGKIRKSKKLAGFL